MEAKKVAWLAFCCGVLSLLLSLLTVWELNHQEEDFVAGARKALREREAELVGRYYPAFKASFADLGVDAYSEPPKTIEELMAPVIEFIRDVTDIPDEDVGAGAGEGPASGSDG